MKVTVHPSQLKGIIQAPASKSSMQRACAAALLSKGTSAIYNPGHSNDDKAALDIIQKLGAKVEVEGSELKIESSGVNPIANEINCDESGLSIRMFTPIVALSDKEITINGSGSLESRPMDFFDDILPLLGVKIQSNDGKELDFVLCDCEPNASKFRFFQGFRSDQYAFSSRPVRVFAVCA